MFVCQCKNIDYNAIAFDVLPDRSGHRVLEIKISLPELFRPKKRAAHGEMSRSRRRGIEVF
jgi:hypothetical protein